MSASPPGGVTTPAHVAAKANDVAGLAAALASSPGDIVATDTVGFTPLHAAAAKNAAEAAALLMSEGASETARDMNGRTPLEVARRLKARDVIILLDPEGPEARAAAKVEVMGTPKTTNMTNDQIEASLRGQGQSGAAVRVPAAETLPLPVGIRAIGQWRGLTWNTCTIDSVYTAGYAVTFWAGEKASDVPLNKLRPMPGESAFGAPPAVGTRVQAGRSGFDWFPCRITGKSATTYEVTYDDGVVESLPPQHVRLELAIGTHVLAQWRGYSWMQATVHSALDYGCSVIVASSETGMSETVPLDSMRPSGMPSFAGYTACPVAGTRVEVKLYGRAWFPGVVKGKSGGYFGGL